MRMSQERAFLRSMCRDDIFLWKWLNQFMDVNFFPALASPFFRWYFPQFGSRWENTFYRMLVCRNASALDQHERTYINEMYEIAAMRIQSKISQKQHTNVFEDTRNVHKVVLATWKKSKTQKKKEMCARQHKSIGNMQESRSLVVALLFFCLLFGRRRTNGREYVFFRRKPELRRTRTKFCLFLIHGFFTRHIEREWNKHALKRTT